MKFTPEIGGRTDNKQTSKQIHPLSELNIEISAFREKKKDLMIFNQD